MKHTPTPWEIEHHGKPESSTHPEYYSIEAACYRGATHNGVVADTLNRDCTIDQETDRANAAFIVRAVNAHDALVEACHAHGLTSDAAIADHLEQTGCPTLARELRERTAQRRAALAKATE